MASAAREHWDLQRTSGLRCNPAGIAVHCAYARWIMVITPDMAALQPGWLPNYLFFFFFPSTRHYPSSVDLAVKVENIGKELDLPRSIWLVFFRRSTSCIPLWSSCQLYGVQSTLFIFPFLPPQFDGNNGHYRDALSLQSTINPIIKKIL